MKLSFSVIFLACLACFVAANWTPEDYEIFSLNDKIKQDLGSDFYQWLGLAKGPKSTTAEISKAYRKLSRKIHPDKYRGNKKSEKKRAEERFQRLSLVGNILRDHNLKQRYDYFLKNGFPKWKGTGYYYSRFQPGVMFVLVVLYVLVSTFQYISLKINRKQDFKRIVKLKDEVKRLAWGGILPPMDGENMKVQTPNGREFLVTPGGEVSLMETDQKQNITLSLLDENDIDINPGIKESYFYRLPAGLWNVTLGRLTGFTINTNVVYVNPHKKETKPEPTSEKKAKKKPKGEKIELPNGKVIYSRKK